MRRTVEGEGGSATGTRTRMEGRLPSSRTLRKPRNSTSSVSLRTCSSVYCAKSSTPCSDGGARSPESTSRAVVLMCFLLLSPRLRLRRAHGKPNALASRPAKRAPPAFCHRTTRWHPPPSAFPDQPPPFPSRLLSPPP